MKTYKTLYASAIFALSLLLLAGSGVAAPNDPSGGWCNELDTSSGLFSACIQAHSAYNRADHLSSVGASGRAVEVAEDQTDAAIAQYYDICAAPYLPDNLPPANTCDVPGLFPNPCGGGDSEVIVAGVVIQC